MAPGELGAIKLLRQKPKVVDVEVEVKKKTVINNTSKAELQVRFFVFFWALAALIDEARQPVSFAEVTVESWLSFSVYVLAATLLRYPGSVPLLFTFAFVFLIQFSFAWPNTTNHSTIIGFVNLLIIAILLHSRIKYGAFLKNGLYFGFPVLRLGFLIMYGSAVVAKLNSDFLLNLQKSCATTLASEELFWLPFEVNFQSLWFLPWLILASELLVFLLPLFQKTRFLGIILAVVFHTALSLTPESKGPAFTLVLFALLGLFFDAETRLEAINSFRAIRAKLRKSVDSWITNFLWLAAIAIQANISFFQAWFAMGSWRWFGTLVINLIWGAAWIYFAIRARKRKLEQPTVSFFGPASVVLMGIVILNSASPYLGGKTTSSMTMYSNLKVEGGKSNHYLFPRLQIHTSQDEIVTIIRTVDPYLNRVRERGYQVTMHELVRVLSRNPDQPIQYEYEGELVSLKRAAEKPELVNYNPILHKLVGHRNITDKCVW